MSKVEFKNEKLVALNPDIQKFLEATTYENGVITEAKDGDAFRAVISKEEASDEEIKRVDDSRAKFVRVATGATALKLAEEVKKNDSIERVSSKTSIIGAGNTVEVTALKSRTSTVNFAKEGEPTETTKYGVTVAKVSYAQRAFKPFRDLLSADLEEHLK